MSCHWREMINSFFLKGVPYFLKEKMWINFHFLEKKIEVCFFNSLSDLHDIEKDNIIIFKVHLWDI